MGYGLSDLIDVEKTRKLLENFSSAVGVSAAIINLEGTVLVASPWQRICVDFHRQNEVTCSRCIESDTVLAADLLEGKSFSLYRCLNGLTDAASPIIIEGKHFANAFIGQFFTEKPDLGFFRRQAAQFGFDEPAYLAALSEVTVIAKETLPSILSFLTSFAEMTARLGLRQLRQLEAEKELNDARLKLEIQNEELQSSERDLNRAQAVAQIGSWRLDVRNNVLHCSDETYRIFGILKGAPVDYQMFLAAVHPDDRGMVDRSWKTALHSGHYNIEHRIVVGDAVKWVHELAELELDRSGVLQGAFGTVQDITERKHMIERIESLARFPDENPSPVLRISRQGEILYANKSSSTLLKFPCVEAKEKLPVDLRKFALETLSAGSVREIEAKCGDAVYLFVFTPFEDLGYVNIYGRDITKRKAAQAKLLRAKEEWERTFDSVPDLIGIVDNQHRIIRANRELAKRLGLTPEQCVGLHCYEAVHGSDRPPEFCPHTRTLTDGLQHNAEVHEKRLGGDFLVSTTPLMDQNGAMIGTVHVARDISERKQMEDELRKSRDELESKVKERTEELQRSNQALQDFAFIASHDLQEPLRKVISFGDLLKVNCRGSLGQTGNDCLNRMLDATNRMRSLLDGLLEYSRVTTTPGAFREVNLGDIVREVLSDLEVRIKKTGGEVKVGELPAIKADPTQMRLLFQNLIGNALKFHKKGVKPLVEVRSAVTGQGLQIVVEDNGIGFEEQYIDRIFAPFQRLHNRSSQYEGTGMGLAICKKIVERHGGNLTARSKPEVGTSFIILFPGENA
jgi:PAS domain S-box-containing protein